MKPYSETDSDPDEDKISFVSPPRGTNTLVQRPEGIQKPVQSKPQDSLDAEPHREDKSQTIKAVSDTETTSDSDSHADAISSTLMQSARDSIGKSKGTRNLKQSFVVRVPRKDEARKCRFTFQRRHLLIMFIVWGRAVNPRPTVEPNMEENVLLLHHQQDSSQTLTPKKEIWKSKGLIGPKGDRSQRSSSAAENKENDILPSNTDYSVTGRQPPTRYKVPRMLKELENDDTSLWMHYSESGSKRRFMDITPLSQSSSKPAGTKVARRSSHTLKGRSRPTNDKTTLSLENTARSSTSMASKGTKIVDKENLLTTSVGKTYDDLNDMDKRLHGLQKGAPSTSTSLPLSWADVGYNLVQEKYFTNKEFKQWGGSQRLKERYEKVRLAIQGLQAAAEPEDEKDQLIYWAEGFDVFDEVGRTIYVNKDIPEYLQSEERLTLSLLHEKQTKMEKTEAFEQNLRKARKELVNNGWL
ncbi:hypothetical protein MMC13_006301 [Lambiella insularis]|nr:hypothetical protein [Lambiella insularis]